MVKTILELSSTISSGRANTGELERRIDGEDHFGIVLNNILRQSKHRCSNLAATADRVFCVLKVFLVGAVRFVDNIGVINSARLDAVDQVENWESGLDRLLVLEVLDRVRLAGLFLLFVCPSNDF